MPEVQSEVGLSYVVYEKDGSDDTSFPITFPYLENEHVYVTVGSTELTQNVDYTVNTGILTLRGTTFNSSGDITTLSNVTDGELIRVFRKTPTNELLREFINGTILTQADLQYVNRQLLYILQEVSELAGADLSNLGPPASGGGITRTEVLVTTGPTDDEDTPKKLNVSKSMITLGPNLYDDNTQVYYNGALMDDDDYTLTGGPSSSTFQVNTANITLNDQDRFEFWSIGGGALVQSSVASNSVFTGAIQNGAVTVSKLGGFTSPGAPFRIILINENGQPSVSTLDAAQISGLSNAITSKRLNEFVQPTDNITMNNNYIVGIPDVTGQGTGYAANKGYVDTECDAHLAQANSYADGLIAALPPSTGTLATHSVNASSTALQSGLTSGIWFIQFRNPGSSANFSLAVDGASIATGITMSTDETYSWVGQLSDNFQISSGSSAPVITAFRVIGL